MIVSRDGNLLAHQRPDPFFQFCMGSGSLLDSRSSKIELDRCLELGVGNEGVIGRRVTVYRDRRMTGALADGVIGWN